MISKVVKESRDVFLKHYTLIQGGDYPPSRPQDRVKPFYTDFTQDTVFATDLNGHHWPVEATKGSEQVKSLAFDKHLPSDWEHIYQSPAQYRSLRTLILPRQFTYFLHMPLSTEEFEKGVIRRLKNGHDGALGGGTVARKFTLWRHQRWGILEGYEYGPVICTCDRTRESIITKVELNC
ncbi:hypothetical protein BDZ45DRAFT_753867 [Acephala macrosclerotiorum]|nr:hypothetical protein BDZ45DRAFT_753867 [Acephala macrosclerotiorum]